VSINYTNVISGLFTQLDSLLNDYVYRSYDAIANHLRYPLGLAIIVFISILGISISQGWVKLSMSNFIKSAIKIGLIYTFAMNWGIFSEWMVHGIQDSAGQIGDWLLQAMPLQVPASAGSGINGALQYVLTEIVSMGWDLIISGNWYNVTPKIIGFIIWIFGCSLIFVAIYEVVLAKVMLAILFATAPLFISLTLFKQTHSFFDRWLGAIAGFIFLLIFISAILALVLSMVQWGINDYQSSHMSTADILSFIPPVVVCVLGIGLVLKVTQLAQAIGGTITTASAAELMAAGIGGFIGARAGNRNSPKRDKDDRNKEYSDNGSKNQTKNGPENTMVYHIQNKLQTGGVEAHDKN
jgi:type IV secretion system protein VirB6